MAGADSIILHHPPFGQRKSSCVKKRGSYLAVPLEADEISHSWTEEGAKGSDYGTDKEDTDLSARASPNPTDNQSHMNKSASTPALTSGLGTKKRSFPKLLPSDELQRLLDGFPSKKSIEKKSRRKSTPAHGHRKSDTQVTPEVKEKLELLPLKLHAASEELHRSSKTQLNEDPSKEGAASGSSTQQPRPRDDEEVVLEALREVVRKCTNPDTSKRPTAAETYEMLLNVYM